MSLHSPSRRAVLRAGAVAAATATALPVVNSTASAAARPDTGVTAEVFPLGAVALLAGPFQSNTARTHAYLKFLDPDRLLHTFRLNVGLPSSAVACGGWESPTTELRGHSSGHVLTALAQAYARTGDTAFRTKGDYLVTQLAACQDRAQTAGFTTGYLSAFPESFITRVEQRQQVWAPYYTLNGVVQDIPVVPGTYARFDRTWAGGDVVEVSLPMALTRESTALGSTTQNWIGRSQYAGDPYLDGAVDSFRVHGRALTAAEVADLHATGR